MTTRQSRDPREELEWEWFKPCKSKFEINEEDQGAIAKGFKGLRVPCLAKFPFESDELVYVWDLDENEQDAGNIGIPADILNTCVQRLISISKATGM